MKFRFVTKAIHAYLDYPVALSLMITPFILGLGKSDPLALWLSVATGVAAFALTFLTDHKTGVIRVLPYRLHVAVDRLVGITFIIAPFVLGFESLDAIYYWANGAAVLLVTFVLNAPETEGRTPILAKS
ncbi:MULTISPECIES: SPW repeat domain-containing protein [unclassified Methylobacterium]